MDIKELIKKSICCDNCIHGGLHIIEDEDGNQCVYPGCEQCRSQCFVITEKSLDELVKKIRDAE